MSIFDKYDLVDVDESFPIPQLPEEGLILLVGGSGTGKSTILRHWFGSTKVTFVEDELWKEFSSPKAAEKYLIACGLRTIPAWRRSYKTLSTGEKHRAKCALILDSGREAIDEFTSVVDRNTAKSLAYSLQKHYREEKVKRLCIASCHRDIIEWLCPTKIYDTDLKDWIDLDTYPRGRLYRPPITIDIKPCNGEKVWNVFKKHHYLSGRLNKTASSFVGIVDGKAVAFCAVLPFPNGNFSNAWRGHRTVVLPEFQGLGIGTAISDCIAEHIVSKGCRFFSKTAHPAMGEHRENSPLWRATSKNGLKRKDYSKNRITKEDRHKMFHRNRRCYSHEFVGKIPQVVI